ncbi:hypothetical protein RSOLAG22IIIB_11007 [Rhizoctonia solani]|uniref:Uncharacterized protein n=1 Tax=Rhizoctonia solani TaxID=456999 RepID=A0A0K6G6C1_9AGAM|nr:hypothetical protein RSOLAG22IIIB_11007 [Rhizoctonia solani]
MFGFILETISFGNGHIKRLLGYVFTPRPWHVSSGEELGRPFATGLAAMVKAVATTFQYRLDGSAYSRAQVRRINNQYGIDDEKSNDFTGSNNKDLNDIESALVETLSDTRVAHGFIPRPLRLGSVCTPSRTGTHARPFSLYSSTGTPSVQRMLEEKKRFRNSTGSIGMGEWLAQLHAGANPHVDQEVMQSMAKAPQDAGDMSPPLTPTTPSLASTSSSTTPASTPPVTPPASPGPISIPKQPVTEIDILSAFPLPPRTVQWKALPMSLPGRLDTIAEEVPVASPDRRRRARCSYNGGKYDVILPLIIPQELLSEEIGVAC